MPVSKIARSFGTHNGTFHADEVTACGLLLLFNQIDQDKIFRTRDQNKLDELEYVCDVGGIYDSERKLFDHHQADYKGRLSSAGMILLYLKEKEIITSEVYNIFNRFLISGVDDHDNGLDPQIPGVTTYSNIISNFTPIHYDCDASEQDAAFFKALEFSLGHLTRMFQRYNYTLSCKEIVLKEMQKKQYYLLFETSIPWMETFFSHNGDFHPALFVIMPSGDKWKLRGIPPSNDERMKVRLPLPLEWAGFLEGDLKRICGIEGAIFCHKGRFISVWETKEDAIKAMEYTMKQSEQGKVE